MSTDKQQDINTNQDTPLSNKLNRLKSEIWVDTNEEIKDPDTRQESLRARENLSKEVEEDIAKEEINTSFESKQSSETLAQALPESKQLIEDKDLLSSQPTEYIAPEDIFLFPDDTKTKIIGRDPLQDTKDLLIWGMESIGTTGQFVLTWIRDLIYLPRDLIRLIANNTNEENTPS